MANNHRKNTSPLREPLFHSLWFAPVASSVVRWMKNNFGSVAPQRHWLLQCLPHRSRSLRLSSASMLSLRRHPLPLPLRTLRLTSRVRPNRRPSRCGGSDRRGGASARLRDIAGRVVIRPNYRRGSANSFPCSRVRLTPVSVRAERSLRRDHTLDILIGIEAEWRRLRRSLSGWTRDLTNRATRLEREIAQARRVTENLGADLRCGRRMRILRLKCFAGSRSRYRRSGRHAKRSKSKERGY